MADRIKLRRGPKNKMDLNVYELAYATDSTEKRLYFNDGEMVPIPNEKDINDIKTELTEATKVSTQSKKDILEIKESVSSIAKTGVAKLVQYSYDIELNENTQRINIPYEKYSSVTDTLKVYVNGLAIQNDQYTITDPVENDGIVTNGYIVLKAEKPTGTIVRIEVWKNVPSGEEGEISGNIIAQNSLPLNRIIGIDDIAIYSSNCTYTDNVYTLTLNNSPTTLGDEFTVRFKAPNAYVDNSSINIGDKSYTVINGNFEEGEIVLVNIDNVNNKAFFRLSRSVGGETETLPSQVDTFSAVAGDVQVTLSWSNSNTDHLEGYYIVYQTEGYPSKVTDGTKIEVSKELNTVTIENLTNDTIYYFRIYPYNSKKQVQSEYKVINATPINSVLLKDAPTPCYAIDENNNKWILISKSDSNLILLSEFVLDIGRNFTTNTNTTAEILYANSLIDEYLTNGDYFTTMLSDNIKKYLIDYTLPDENINRQVFLISLNELKNAYSSCGVPNSVYYGKHTDGTVVNWWLRTKVSTNNMFYMVTTGGSQSTKVGSTIYGIRPAVSVSLETKCSTEPNSDGYYTII